MELIDTYVENGNYVELVSKGAHGSKIGYINGEEVMNISPRRGDQGEAKEELIDAMPIEARYRASNPLHAYDRVKRYLDFNDGVASLREIMEATQLDKDEVYKQISAIDRKEYAIMDYDNPTFKTLEYPDDMDNIVEMMKDRDGFMKGVTQSFLEDRMTPAEARGAIHWIKQRYDVKEDDTGYSTQYYL